jgi:hypothetical protein
MVIVFVASDGPVLDDPAIDGPQLPPPAGAQVVVFQYDRHGRHLGNEPIEGFDGQFCGGRELQRAGRVTLAPRGVELRGCPSSFWKHVDRERPAPLYLTG